MSMQIAMIIMLYYLMPDSAHAQGGFMVLHLPCYAWCFFIGHDLGGPQSVALTSLHLQPESCGRLVLCTGL